MATISETSDLIELLRGAMFTSHLWSGGGVTVTKSAFAVLKKMDLNDSTRSWDDLVKLGVITIVDDGSQTLPIRPRMDASLPKPPATGAMVFESQQVTDETIQDDTDRSLGVGRFGPHPSPSPSPSSGGGANGEVGVFLDKLRKYFRQV